MNNDKEILNLFEDLNYNYLLISNENKKRNNFSLLINSIKTFNFSYALKRFFNKKNKNLKKENNSQPIAPYVLNSENNFKVAIYTCITGSYDNICVPYVLEKNCDYYIFTNNDRIMSDVWKKRKIPDNILSLKDNVLINRYIKMHPFELFDDKKYDFAIYIDGNISIISDISSFCKKVSNITGLAFHKHYNKNCAYDEMKICEIIGKGNCSMIKKQEKRYKKEGFPCNYGLFECNVIVSDLKNKKGNDILNYWWNEFYNSKSFRDQLSFPYALWKLKYKSSDIGIIEDNVFLNKKIRINNHI